MDQRKINWTVRALENKFDIFDFWINNNSSTKYVEKLEILFNEALKTAAIFPSAGIPTEIKNVRMILVRNYKIFYRIKPDSIEVITIWDGRRNPKNLKI
ncbi:MAG TPA: type II toxin-antitoxin system RelE/ParE family toxin [Salinimicrobium sp.]|nr:type II toxin-antitoxin system RelE/ParE family toxin [Salinimicrobium sp.]